MRHFLVIFKQCEVNSFLTFYDIGLRGHGGHSDFLCQTFKDYLLHIQNTICITNYGESRVRLSCQVICV